MLPLPRLLPALITPFDRTGEVDLDAHSHNLSVLWDRGIRGFLIAGSTGEGPYLEPGERHVLVEAARRALGKRAVVLCGIAAETTRQALSMISEAAAGGADAALVITPTTLVRNRIHYVEGFYESVADASPLPVYLYSVPGVTAFELPEALVARLSRHPNIVGIKDSGGDPVRMQRLVAGADDGFQLVTGSSQALTLALAAGAYGAITASTNYVPELALMIVETARRNPKAARDLQRKLSTVAAAVEAHGIPGVKAASRHSGLRAGAPRRPLMPLDRKTARRLEEEVAEAKIPIAVAT